MRRRWATGRTTSRLRCLLPQSVAAAGGYVFVLDLVNRSIKAYAERTVDGRPALESLDAMAAFGGDRTAGDLWMPYALSATARDDGVELIVPDAVLNVVYRYRWTPPS